MRRDAMPTVSDGLAWVVVFGPAAAALLLTIIAAARTDRGSAGGFAVWRAAARQLLPVGLAALTVGYLVCSGVALGIRSHLAHDLAAADWQELRYIEQQIGPAWQDPLLSKR